MENVKDFIQYLLKSNDDSDSLKLIDFFYSSSHSEEVCRVQLIGKNIFPIYTTDEILKSKKLFDAFSKEDLLKIKEIDLRIKERTTRNTVLEIDLNGTILLKDGRGRIKRYAERLISSDKEMIASLNSHDAHSLGYRVGYKDGLNATNEKAKLKKTKFKATLKKLFPLCKDKR